MLRGVYPEQVEGLSLTCPELSSENEKAMPHSLYRGLPHIWQGTAGRGGLLWIIRDFHAKVRTYIRETPAVRKEPRREES